MARRIAQFAAKLGLLLSAFRRGRGGNDNATTGRAKELLIMQPDAEGVRCVHLKRDRSGVRVRANSFHSAKDASSFLGRLTKKCLTVALLPKASYLLKFMEVPRVRADEIAEMISLEMEADLPNEFGQAEISYQRLPCEKEGCQRYEVYLCRRDDVLEFVRRLESMGIPPRMILPSAVAWRRLLEGERGVDMVAAETGRDGQLELAMLQPDRSLSVRTIDNVCREAPPDLPEGLIECVRSLLAQSDGSSEAIDVFWAGERCPPDNLGGRIRFRSEADSFGNVVFRGDGATGEYCMLRLAGSALLDADHATTLREANLIPRDLVVRRRRAAVRKVLGVAAVAAVAGLVCLQVALEVATRRWNGRIDEVSAQIASIRKEGEAIGRGIERLRAAREARLTRNDFHDLLAGLYQATPNGVTYSHVALDETGTIRLRGQAESMALPFLLPQELEKHPVFSQVLLKDAGQVKRPSGSVTEFQIEAAIRRQEGQ